MNLVPFDPNGMVMDLLRSCSKQLMMPVANSPLTKVLATWYRAAPTATVFPGEHSFGSPVWDSEHPTTTTLGFDANAPRIYYNGKRENASDGTRFAGPADYFVNGAPALALLPRGVNETPVECLLPPWGLVTGGQAIPVIAAAGGLRTGGSATAPVSVASTIRYWTWSTPGNTPTQIRWTISSAAFGSGTIYGQQTQSFAPTFVLLNSFGFNVYEVDLPLGLVGGTLPHATTLWLTLDNAVGTGFFPVYWDESSGPSSAQSSGIGVIPSESFRILDGLGVVLYDNVVSMAFATNAYTLNFGFQVTDTFSIP